MGKAINELDSAASITDATLVPVGETDTLKKTTWATVKSTLKTYFDGLYQAASANLTSWAALATSAKQDTLVSGTNIKTINSTSLMGSGDLTVSASPGGSTTQVQYNSAGAFAGASGITTTGTELVIASGTQTTSKPVLDLSQTWNDAGVTFTGVKLNVTNTASAAASLLMDLQVGGVSKFKTTKTGDATVAGTLYGGAISSISGYIESGEIRSGVGSARSWIMYNGKQYMASNSIVGWGPSAIGSGDAYNNQDVAVGRNGIGVVEINSGTAGTYRDLKLRNLIASGGVVTLASFTVATLPSASTSGAGAMAYVTDSNATTYRATVAGGGSDKVTVTSDGSNWIITG